MVEVEGNAGHEGTLRNITVETVSTNDSKKVGADIRPLLEKLFANNHEQRPQMVRKYPKEKDDNDLASQTPNDTPVPLPKPRKSLKPPTPKPRILQIQPPTPKPRPDKTRSLRRKHLWTILNWKYIFSKLRYFKMTTTLLLIASSLVWPKYEHERPDFRSSDKGTTTLFQTIVPGAHKYFRWRGVMDSKNPLLPTEPFRNSSLEERKPYHELVQECPNVIRNRQVIANQAKFIHKKISRNLSVFGSGFELNPIGMKQSMLEVLSVSTNGTKIDPEFVSLWFSEKSKMVSEKVPQILMESSLKLGNHWDKILSHFVPYHDEVCLKLENELSPSEEESINPTTIVGVGGITSLVLVMIKIFY